jgi:hypothetical protein
MPSACGDRTQQRALAGTGRAFQHDVPVGRQRRDHQFELATTSDDLPEQAVDEPRRPVGHQSYFSTPRMLVPARIAS